MLERRKSKRINFNGFADVFDSFYNFISRANVHNISPEGTAIISTMPIRVGTTVIFNILQKESEGFNFFRQAPLVYLQLFLKHNLKGGFKRMKIILFLKQCKCFFY